MTDNVALTDAEIASNLSVIENTEASDLSVELATKLLEKTPYASTALCAMSIALSEMKDFKGASILLAASLEMAKYEAETI